MEFVIIARDASEEGTLARRMNARPRHLAGVETLVREGHLLYAAALLDEEQRMNGTVFICDFEDRAQLDAWLRDEPYVVENVWKDIEVRRCQIGPMFRRPPAS